MHVIRSAAKALDFTQLGSGVIVPLNGETVASVRVSNLTGTGGTLIIEVSEDGGHNWETARFAKVDVGTYTPQTSINNDGTYMADVAARTHFRVRNTNIVSNLSVTAGYVAIVAGVDIQARIFLSSIAASGSGGVTNVTPAAATADHITTGGTAVTAIAGPISGGFIVNPLNATAQGIGAAENLYIDMVGTPGSTDAAAHGTTSLLSAGQSFTLPPVASGVNVKVNAATSGHKFTIVVW
jgi:hypothetical protein